MATLKYSRQRESIKEFLTGRTDHPTADFVYENMFAEYVHHSAAAGAHKVTMGNGAGIESVCSAKAGKLLYFTQISEKREVSVYSEHIDKSLESIAADFKDGQISDYKARFFGICKECLKEESH